MRYNIFRFIYIYLHALCKVHQSDWFLRSQYGFTSLERVWHKWNVALELLPRLISCRSKQCPFYTWSMMIIKAIRKKNNQKLKDTKTIITK